MTHCTPTVFLSRSARRAGTTLRVFLVALAASGLVGGFVARVARADGDPASDVLASQNLFLAGDGGVSTADQLRLTALLRNAAQAGYPIRVAVIASPTDLGSVSALWRQPAAYARFLAQELALVDHGQLLIVMPNGYGHAVLAGVHTRGAPVPAGLSAPSNRLGAAAMSAVQRLASSAGHPLSPLSTIAVADHGTTDLVPWLALAIGAGLVIAAWVVSVRIRPLGLRG